MFNLFVRSLYLSTILASFVPSTFAMDPDKQEIINEQYAIAKKNHQQAVDAGLKTWKDWDDKKNELYNKIKNDVDAVFSNLGSSAFSSNPPSSSSYPVNNMNLYTQGQPLLESDDSPFARWKQKQEESKSKKPRSFDEWKQAQDQQETQQRRSFTEWKQAQDQEEIQQQMETLNISTSNSNQDWNYSNNYPVQSQPTNFEIQKIIDEQYATAKAKHQRDVDAGRTTWAAWDKEKKNVYKTIEDEVKKVFGQSVLSSISPQNTKIGNDNSGLLNFSQKKPSGIETDPLAQKYLIWLKTGNYGDQATIDLKTLDPNSYIAWFGTAQKGFNLKQHDNNGYAWLSNYHVAGKENPNSSFTPHYEIKVKVNGQVYSATNVETIYHLFKFTDSNTGVNVSDFCKLSPDEARNQSRQVGKFNFGKANQWMEHLLEQKFFNNNLMAKALVGTGDKLLFEGNSWNDTRFGMSLNGTILQGEGKLGKMLTRVRDKIRTKMSADSNFKAFVETSKEQNFEWVAPKDLAHF